MEFIPVQSFNNYVEAHIAMGNLQQQHINCWLKDEYSVTIDPMLANAIGGIKLMVAKVQVPRAMEILKKAINSEQEQYACPHCGSHNITAVEIPSKKLNLFTVLLSRLFGSGAATNKQVWHCPDCGTNTNIPTAISAAAMEDAG